MDEISIAPDVSGLEIVEDAWTAPFWESALKGELVLPRCGTCRHFRWPPGPYCPNCLSQRVDWVPAGPARLFSFTAVRKTDAEGKTMLHVPGLVEFPQADGIRIVAAIVGARLETLRIGQSLAISWSPASNGRIPIFTVEGEDQVRR